jgi:hypothetical protein
MHIKPGSRGETQVRLMKAKPNSPRKGQQVDYVRWEIDRKSMDKYGNFVKAASEESHIPLDEFEFKPELFND